MLSQKNCQPLSSSESALQNEQIQKYLPQINSEWKLNSKGHLERTFNFSCHDDVVRFFLKVSEIAKKQHHHPICTTSCSHCTLEIWTHKLDGLVENDFILASKFDNM